MKKVNVSYNEIIYSENWLKYRDDKYFDYRKRWSEYPTKHIVSEFPLHLDIETTELCNLKCPMCPRTIIDKNNKNKKNKFITKEEYIRIIDEATQYDLRSIKLQYLGEPLIDENLPFYIKYAKEKGVIDVMFNTNGLLLTKELSQKLLEAGLDKIFISIDAINPKLYEQQRVGGSLGVVINNVYNFIKLRNKISPKTHIRISMVMYEGEIWKKQFEGLKIMWEGLVDAIGYGIFNDRNKIELAPKVNGFVCEQLFQRMFLRCDGSVTVCCVDDRKEYVVGNWKKEKLYEIWHNEKYNFIRQKHINNEYYDIEICKKCHLPSIAAKNDS